MFLMILFVDYFVIVRLLEEKLVEDNKFWFNIVGFGVVIKFYIGYFYIWG